jgi:hypothetical protein
MSRQVSPFASPRVKIVMKIGGLILGLIAAIALIALVGFAVSRPPTDSLEFELAKASIQILTIATIGFVVGVITFAFQHEYVASADSIRRRDEEARDERRREDDLLRDILDRTIIEYHRLKKERRVMRAKLAGPLTVESYDDVIFRINDVQLAFEQLKRESPLVERIARRSYVPVTRTAKTRTVRPAFVSLGTCFGKIEEYLHNIIKEYETTRSAFVALTAPEIAASRLPALTALTAPHKRGGDFVPSVSYYIDLIVDATVAAMLTPVDLGRGAG